MTSPLPDVDAALRALADRNRRSILAVVRDRPHAVGEIAEQVTSARRYVETSFASRAVKP